MFVNSFPLCARLDAGWYVESGVVGRSRLLGVLFGSRWTLRFFVASRTLVLDAKDLAVMSRIGTARGCASMRSMSLGFCGPWTSGARAPQVLSCAMLAVVCTTESAILSPLAAASTALLLHSSPQLAVTLPCAVSPRPSPVRYTPLATQPTWAGEPVLL